MAVLHISEAELARAVPRVLDRVQSGAEIIVERNARPVAVLRAAESQPGTSTGNPTREYSDATQADEYSQIRQAIVASRLPMLSDDEVRAEIRERKSDTAEP